MIPFTSAHVRPIAAPVKGLVPTFPSIDVLKTSVIPDSDKTVKLLAEPRFTGVSGAAAAAVVVPAANIEMIAMGMTERVLSLKILLRSSIGEVHVPDRIRSGVLDPCPKSALIEACKA